MKRFSKLIVVLVFVLSLCMLLSSCGFLGSLFGNKPGGDADKNPGGDTQEKDNLIYNSKSELYIVMGSNADANIAFELQNAVDTARNAETPASPIPAAGSEEKKHEIVIGETDRPITATAKSHLGRINKQSDSHLAYLIYSNGSSVAIVFDEDERGVNQKLAIEYFIEHYAVDELIAAKGDMYKTSYDLIEDYYRVLDNEHRDEQWAALREKLEPSIANQFISAMQQLYSIYSPDVVTWLANLYEPNICICYGMYGEEECQQTKYCGNAGIYYSNSGRDTIGYLPDAESTSQALGFLQTSGMSYLYNGKYSEWLPEDMKQKMGRFAQVMQDPNGFFYHPQWGKDYIENNNKDSRRARDLGHCENLLSLAGMQPYYTTPNGWAGMGAPASGKLTSPIGEGSVAAVSKVILVSDDNYAEHLKDEKSFREYLNGYDIRHQSYSVGNRIGSQISQIQARDKQIGTADDPTPLMDELINYLVTNQNPETGCWNWNYKENGKPHTGAELYESVNGLLKIVNDFTEAGVKMPYAKEAAITAMAAVTDPLAADAVTDIYNTWYAIGWVIDNLRACADKGDISAGNEADEINRVLQTMAVDGIRASMQKINVFQKPDGSFSYGPKYSAQTSQGCQVALPNSPEGDVNATVISVNGIRNHIFHAFELQSYMPILFGEAERIIYLDIINNATSVKKNEIKETGDPITFDYEDTGIPSDELVLELGAGGGSANVVEDPRGDGNVVKIVTHAGVGDYITVPNQTNSVLAQTYAFESEFMLESSSLKDDSYFIQIVLGQKNYTSYMFTFTLVGDEIVVTEHSSHDWATDVAEELGTVGRLGEWFKVRVEYYYSENMDDVRIKFYYDDNLEDEGEMKLLAVTDNFYDRSGNKYLIGDGEPNKYFEYTKMYMMSGTEAVLYMDNCMTYKVQNSYVPVTDPNKQPPINIDPPDSPEKIYDFEDGTVPTDLTVKGTGITVVDNALNIAQGSINVPVNVRTMGARTINTSFDITPVSGAAGSTVMRLVGLDGEKGMFGLNLVVKEDSDGKYLTLAEYNSETVGAELSNVRLPFGEKSALKIAYFHKQDMILIYVDGNFVAATSVMYPDGIKGTMDNFRLETIDGASFKLTVDNLKAEKNTDLFIDAVAPTTPPAPHTFEAADDKAVLSGSAVIGGGVLTINTKTAAGSVSVPVHERAAIHNILKFSADIKITDATASGELYRINFAASDGKTVFSLALVKNAEGIAICQVSEGGLVPEPIYTFDYGEFFNLSFEIYQEHKMVHIIEGGEVKAKTSVFYNPANVMLDVATATVTSSGSAKASLELDNLNFESYYGAYLKANPSSKVQPDENLHDGLTFELSNSGKLTTTNIQTLQNSPKAAVRVEQMINTLMKDKNPNGEWSNVLAFDTCAGANDSLMFQASAPLGMSTCITFEADIKFAMSKPTGSAFQFFMSDKSRNNKVIMIQFGTTEDGKVTVAEQSSNSWASSITNEFDVDINADDWFNLKVEFYKGARGAVRFKYFINDELIMITDNFYGSMDKNAAPNSVLELIQIMSLNAADGTIYVDNVSLTGSDKTCTEAPTCPSSPS